MSDEVQMLVYIYLYALFVMIKVSVVLDAERRGISFHHRTCVSLYIGQ